MNISALSNGKPEPKNRLFALIGLFLIFFYAVADLQLELWYRILTHYTDVLMISFIALSFYLRLFKRRWEERFVWLYIAWLFITRVLNGDLYLYEEYHLVVRQVALSCAFISIGFLLDNDDRQRFFNIAIWGVCLYWLLLAALGLYAAINQTRIALPFIEATAGVGKVAGNYQLTVDYTHRNVSGVWFALAAVLMICQFFRSKNVVLRVVTVISGVIFYFATAMSFCRSAQIGLCVAIAMLIILLALKKFSHKGTAFKTFLILAIIVIVIPISYKGFSAANSMCSFVSEKIVNSQESVVEEKVPETIPTAAEEKSETEVPSAEKQSEEDVIFEENRSKKNVMILGGRKYLWHAGLIVLKEEPQQLLKGGSSSEYTEEVRKLYDQMLNREPTQSNGNMHNFLYDALMLTGLPGAVLLLLFSIFLVIRMVKVFFSTKPEVTIGLKILTLPIAMLLIDNMMEAHIFKVDYVHCFLFFAIVGVFLAWSYEVLPRVKKK